MPNKSMSDAVQAYIIADNEQKDNIEKENAKKKEEVLIMVSRLELVPISVEYGNIVSFEWKGAIVKFKIWKSNFVWAMCRIGVCEECGGELSTFEEWSISLETFGKLIIEPNWKTYEHRHNKSYDPAKNFVEAFQELLANYDIEE